MARKKKQPVSKAVHKIKSEDMRAALTILLVILGFALIYISSIATVLGYIGQWALAVFSLIVIGTLIRSVNSLVGWYGIYLASTQKGISLIDRMAQKYKWFWNGMAMWGIVLGLGLMAYPFLKGKIDKRLFAFSMLSLFAITYFFLVFYIGGGSAISSGFQFITLPQLQVPASGTSFTGSPPLSLFGYGIIAVTLVFGFTGLFVLLLLINAGTIVLKTALYAGTVISGVPQNSILASVVPGVAPLIPGIDIPLVAGVASLAVLLIVHEGAHGVLSRIAKVRLKSVGLLVLGVIPVGAFVEPDERQVSRLDSTRQSRLLAAGSASNFVWAVIFFALLTAMTLFVLPGLSGVFVYSTAPGYPAYNALTPGTQIFYWNGYKIQTISNAEAATANVLPGEKETLVTSTGNYTLTAIAQNGSARGFIGVTPYQSIKYSGTWGSILQFLYSFFSLSLLFNFSLAVINLFPIPMFDGWRLYKVNIKSNRKIRLMAIFVSLLILINLFAWFLIAIA